MWLMTGRASCRKILFINTPGQGISHDVEVQPHRIQLHPHTHHIVTLDLWTDPAGGDCTTGQMDGEASWWSPSGKMGLTLLARVMGVGRQHLIQ